MRSFWVFISLMMLSAGAIADEKSDALAKIVAHMKSWSTDPALVAAVKQQNAKLMTPESIRARDEKWMATPGVDDFMKSLLTNSAAKRLMALEKSKPYFMEIFLMDNQGANVAMTNKTSDYWQGDEAKWQKSFDGGKGATFVDKEKFDESTQTYLVQISIPIMDDNKAIGALTAGVDIGKLLK